MKPFRNAPACTVRSAAGRDFGSRIGGTVGIIATVALGLLATPVPTYGQQPGKVYRIGWLGHSTFGYETDPHQCPVQGNPTWQALMTGLREHGYIPGQNLLLECRWTEGQVERAPALAAELVSLQPDLIVAASATANVRAAKQATRTIPIVLVNVNYPVEQGLVASLAHPGGNVTGVAGSAGGEIFGKRLQLLKEAIPNVSRVAVLRYLDPGYTSSPGGGREREVAQALHLALQLYRVRAPEELEGAFSAMTKARADSLYVEDWAFLYVHAHRVVELAAKSRLPAMYTGRPFVEAGGLMAYAVNALNIFRRLGFYVDKIFHGAKPSDLPVEQPTKFELVINLKTAKALGLTIPQSLLSRADEVIQ